MLLLMMKPKVGWLPERTVRGLGQQKTKVLSTGSTLAVTQVSVKKRNVPVKCKICSKERGLWLCELFKALPVDQRWEKSTRTTSLLQLPIPLP